MESEDSLVRAVRLTRIPFYLQSHSKGLTTKELADLCGVSCRTMQRDINALESDLKLPIMQKGTRFLLSGDYVLPPVAFTLYESVALFLASRLALRQADENNPHINSAISKMAGILPHPLTLKLRHGMTFFKNKKINAKFIRIYEHIALAWITQTQVNISYQSLQSNEVKEWLLEPYFMEMTGVGYSSYVIGHAVREGKEGIITFKLERIKKVKLTETKFEIPQGIDIDELMSSSWGVIWGNDIEVILKFSPRVTRRVKESVWHPSQVITESSDGGCRLKLKVGSLLEITPWIRSWGPDVEVLEPDNLRKEFSTWAKQSFKMYSNDEQ